jgi:hypothetical protein
MTDRKPAEGSPHAMTELQRALNDIAAMREQLARSCEFHGFGPKTLAMTGLLAFAVAATQPLWLGDASAHAERFVLEWFATALLSITLIGIEAVARARREHGSMALPFLQTALQHFAPAIAAGGLLTAALLRNVPQSAWMLPGLWQLLFSVGAFAAARMLPRPMYLVGVWYLVCGLFCLQHPAARSLDGWTMGIPFGMGQLLVAGIIAFQRRGSEDE